jgi:hypothetical protein
VGFVYWESALSLERKTGFGGIGMHAGSELLFPPYAILPLRDLRGPEWHALVKHIASLPETHPESLAFSLMMVRLDGCLTCETDSYKAMRGCVQCAIQTIRRFKEDDEELFALYNQALRDVTEYMEATAQHQKKAA